MNPTNRSSLLLLLAGLSLMTACGATSASNAPTGPDAPKDFPEVTALERWMPLKDGSLFSYQTEHRAAGSAPNAPAELGLLTLQVVRTDATHVQLRGGSTVRHLTLKEDAISDAGGGELLKSPLQLGASWVGLAGPVKITQLDVAIEVPAGKFHDCLNTEEFAADATTERSVVTTWCQGVGMVQFVVRHQSDQGEDVMVAKLRFHGPKIELGPSGTRVLAAP
jgi:hypothetical protein